MKAETEGTACSGNKECVSLSLHMHQVMTSSARRCLSYNCDSSGKCGRAADEPLTPAAFVYALIGLGIVGRVHLPSESNQLQLIQHLVILGVLVGLWFTHRRSRKENQIRLEQYYNEQVSCPSLTGGHCRQLIGADRLSKIDHVHVTCEELLALFTAQYCLSCNTFMGELTHIDFRCSPPIDDFRRRLCLYLDNRRSRSFTSKHAARE